MKRIIIVLLGVIAIFTAKGQIGYQVTLLNTATGEPRANETVSVSLDITDSSGGVIYSGSQTATSNDFGVLSLNVGNATTFDNAEWSKLPFFVSATVDVVLIGRSQILSVPVAEYAKRTGQLTPEILCSKDWYCEHSYTALHFHQNGIVTVSEEFYHETLGHITENTDYKYFINLNTVYLIKGEECCESYDYIPQMHLLYQNYSTSKTFQ